MKTLCAIAAVSVCAMGTGRALAETASPVLDQCVTRLVDGIDHAKGNVAAITEMAEVVAKRWLAGSMLCAAGTEAFAEEAFYRAGGLIGMARLSPRKADWNDDLRQIWWDELPRDAIVVYGLHRAVDPTVNVFTDIQRLGRKGRTVVLVGSGRWPVTKKLLAYCQSRLGSGYVFLLDTDLPCDTRLMSSGGVGVGDYGPGVTAVHFWTFVSEVVSACTRAGKMPAIWPSGTIPDFEKWEAKYMKTVFHDDYTVAPIAAGRLAGEFLSTVREQVLACRASAGALREAAGVLAGRAKGKTTYMVVEGHLLADEAWLPTDLDDWMLVKRSWRWGRAAPTVESGDAVVWLGYLRWPDGVVRRLTDARASFVGITVQGPAAGGDGERVWPWVPAPWTYPDAVVGIEGYPMKVAPTSGIVQTALLWGLVGEVLDGARTPSVTKASELAPPVVR